MKTLTLSNKLQKKRFLAKKLQSESLLVQAESMKVLAEFETLVVRNIKFRNK